MSKKLSTLADKIYERNEARKALEAQAKEIGKEVETMSEELLAAMDEAGLTNVKTPVVSVSVNESVVPQVDNWDEFYKFVKKKNYFHLLERRPSTTGCRELFELGQTIPGVERFLKRKVNLRAAS